MAKLEAQVTALELLDAIRDGATKNELTKKYRTSDTELASMLHPLFRTGKMTASEFNDFFKGLSVKPPEPEPVEAPVETAEIPMEEPKPAELMTFLTQTDGDELDLDEEFGDVSVPADEPPGSATETLPVFSSAAQEATTDNPIPDEPIVGETPAIDVAKTTDSAGMSALLELIFAKLTAIDSRLAEIEKKLRLS